MKTSEMKLLNYYDLIEKNSITLPDEGLAREFHIKKIELNNVGDIEFSIVMTVFNQRHIICKHIEAVLRYTQGPSELILILDYCVDVSEEKILNFFKNHNDEYKNFKSVTIIKHEKFPIFEASCDNVGFMLSEGRFCLEIQGDQEMIEDGYNLQLARPFDVFENCIGVSGRCAHQRGGSDVAGAKCWDVEKSTSDSDFSRDIFYERETCNRGPLLLHRQKLKSLNFLDEKNFHQCNSEHDMFFRAYYYHKYICGHIAIDFNSPEHARGAGRIHHIGMEAHDINESLRSKRLLQRDDDLPPHDLWNTGFLKNIDSKMPVKAPKDLPI
jgi:hypothetical protein